MHKYLNNKMSIFSILIQTSILAFVLFFQIFSVNGTEETDIHLPVYKYPYVVLIQLKVRKNYCSGALLTNQWVLTSGHCVYHENDKSIRVYIGNVSIRAIKEENSANHNLETEFQVRSSKAVILPWGYRRKPSFGKSDIALIKVERFNSSKMPVKRTPLLLFLPPDGKNVICEVVGYDIRQKKLYTDHKDQTYLLVYELLVERLCRHYESSTSIILKSFFKYRSWICQADHSSLREDLIYSGALLLCGRHKLSLSGLAIGKFTIDEHNEPVVFLDICPYLTWIRSHVGHTVMYSPGIFGEGCYDSMSSKRSQEMTWFSVLALLFLYSYIE